jgi:hypothetical protein
VAVWTGTRVEGCDTASFYVHEFNVRQ